jgi:hypothetical protein
MRDLKHKNSNALTPAHTNARAHTNAKSPLTFSDSCVNLLRLFNKKLLSGRIFDVNGGNLLDGILLLSATWRRLVASDTESKGLSARARTA